MKILYDSVAANWYQASVKNTVTFGGDKLLLPYKEAFSYNDLTANLNLENSHAGPFIGIVTARKADGTITGNSALFVKLQKKLLLHGGLSYIFTPDDVLGDFINGFIFLPDSKHWRKVTVPFPDLVYNRIPFRKTEQEDLCQALFSMVRRKNIPFFNPCFLDKFELYSLLESHGSLKQHLPETELVSDIQTFYAFLEKHQTVYLKPAHSAQGKGIFKLSCKNPPHLSLTGLKGTKIYPSFTDFWEEWATDLFQKQYLIQAEVDSATYEGKKFDLRILAHAYMDEYMVTGIGIRQAQEQEVTTHVPNGGRILPYQLFQTQELDQFINNAVNQIGKVLTRHYGFFGEFSIDAGISSGGDCYLYEVNSKPMSFDEAEIEGNKIEQLCRLFFQLTGFPYTNENPAPVEE